MAHWDPWERYGTQIEDQYVDSSEALAGVDSKLSDMETRSVIWFSAGVWYGQIDVIISSHTATTK